jgi:hypothetical protein
LNSTRSINTKSSGLPKPRSKPISNALIGLEAIRACTRYNAAAEKSIVMSTITVETILKLIEQLPPHPFENCCKELTFAVLIGKRKFLNNL